MTENCFGCGKEVPFKFMVFFCDDCTQEKVSAEDYWNKHWKHVDRAVKNYFEFTISEQDRIKSFVNNNLAR